ncbi:unnamed protein product [Rotaria socialis]|uniref:K Homology domain-containing protein n=1 Tax=Rotaria socialis TaxID=392032 RepID=A0A820RDP5_9BILA|nr:unnamed protein product [Rotaria socialis]CAF4439548.1 unnamed protein product [Rotaria socialis]
MDVLTDDNFLRENGLTKTVGMNSGATSNVNDIDDAPDYNEEFPHLKSANSLDLTRSSTFFSSSSFASSLNGSLGNTTAALYTSSRIDEDRRRQIAIHEKSATTKIIEIPPEERITDNPRRGGGNQSTRNGIGSNLSVNNGPPLQKLCIRIQKETSTNITFFHKDETLIVTITGRPEQVRSAQVQILRELQKPVKIAVNIPLDFHRFIIGPRGATLKHLEQETLTRIAVPRQESQSDGIVISGAKDNVKLCEQKILELYHIQENKGYERLSIPYLYHPWIRHQLVEELRRQLNVTIDLPPLIKQTDEISIRGEREPVEKAKTTIMQFFQSLEGKIMTFPLEIPCEQHRFILGKKGAGLKEIFDKTNVVVRIPNQEENLPIIQVIGETSRIGEAITMIYKMANALTAVRINAPHWMHSVVKGERSGNLDIIKKSHPDVRIFFRDDHIAVEGPPEEVELVRGQIQTVIDDLRNNNTTYLEMDIDPNYYKQLIGKNQIRLTEMQEQTGCDIKFPFDESRVVKLMGTKESVDKARQVLLERVQKLSNERTTGVSIDPQYYPQIIGAKGKKLEEVRSKFHNIQITFPEANGKSDKVILHGDKEDVEKCSKFLQQKIKDLYSTEIELSKRFYPLLIGKSGANIQRLREQMPDVRIDVPAVDDSEEFLHIRLSGKRIDVDKGRKILDEHLNQLRVSLENSIEQHITIDPKWHNRFFMNKRKLLNNLQKKSGDALIKFPERNINSDQILLRGTKQAVEQVRKCLEELIDTWENTTTKEISIPHRHHGYLLAQGGFYIQPIQKQFNVQIKFPPRNNEQDSPNDDIVRIIGRTDDIEQAVVALEKMIPIETTVDITFEAHGHLRGTGGSQIQTLVEKYPDVKITFPSSNSSSNNIHLKGQAEQVEGFKKELLERYEKYLADKQARSFETRFTIKSEFRSIIIGNRRRRINDLKQKYDVNIQILNNQVPPSAVVPVPPPMTNGEQQHDDQQAIPVDNPSLTTESTSSEVEVLIRGYEDKALKCRDEILKLIGDFQSTITMEMDIDHRVHARIIGTGGQKLQQIVKEYNVDIKFPSDNRSNKVHVIGTNQENIDACIDHLSILEEDFLEDLPYKNKTQNDTRSGQQSSNVQQRQQEVPSANNSNTNKSTKNNDKQTAFKVKNAPWAASEHNGYEDQQETVVKERRNSSRKGHRTPNKDDLGEFPSFANGVTLSTDENSSKIHETTVNSIPIIWGPQKRNK